MEFYIQLSMCILFIAINQHADYPTIICANRDEFYARATQPADFWHDHPEILAGRDLKAGGSWLGVNKQGKFAAITNIRTGMANDPNKRSRGELVTMSLVNNSIINQTWLEQNSDDYNPFNLIYGSGQRLYCYNSENKQQVELNDGFHAISNGSLDDIWPKMAKGENELERAVLGKKQLVTDELFSILTDTTQANPSELPHTGIPIEWEQKLSSIFINVPDYGTRSSCLVLFNKAGQLEFVERTFDQTGQQILVKDYAIKC